MDEDGRARRAMQASEASHVVNVRVRADDGADLEIVAREDFENALNFIPRVHHDGFVAGGIAQNGAVALQQADGDDFVNELFRHAIRV